MIGAIRLQQAAGKNGVVKGLSGTMAISRNSRVFFLTPCDRLYVMMNIRIEGFPVFRLD